MSHDQFMYLFAGCELIVIILLFFSVLQLRNDLKDNEEELGDEQERSISLFEELRDKKTELKNLNGSFDHLIKRNTILEFENGNVDKHYLIHSEILQDEKAKNAFNNFLAVLNTSKEIWPEQTESIK